MVGRYDTERARGAVARLRGRHAAAGRRHRLHGRHRRDRRARARRRRARDCRRSRCAACAGRSSSAPSPASSASPPARCCALIGQAPELVAGGASVALDARARHAVPDRLRRRELLSRGHRPPPARGWWRWPAANLAQRRPQLAADRRPPRLARARRRGRGARRHARARGDGRPGSSSGCCGCPSSRRWRGAAPALGPGRLGGGRARCGASASPAAPPTSSRPSPSPRWPRRRACSAPTALAAYTILHNIEALVFMIALGLSVGDGGPDRPGGRRRRRGRGALRRLRRARRGDGPRRARSALALLAAAPARRRLLQRRPGADRPRRADHRDPRGLDGLRRRAGGARPVDPRPRRQLGDHALPSSSPSSA